MDADWIETGIDGANRHADILLELRGTPSEIEEVRQMMRRASGWSAIVTGPKRDRIVLKMEEAERWGHVRTRFWTRSESTGP